MSNVAGGKDARHARLEQKRSALERPITVAAKIGPRENKALPISINLLWQPLGMGASSDHEEEHIGIDALLAPVCAITKHELLQPSVTPTARDLGPETDLQLWFRLDLANQVVRHPSAQ